MTTELRLGLERVRSVIAAAGPITVAEYMTLALHDPAFGYYATRPALGVAGDFLTAPLVSQMFGELIGLWALECWERLGQPTPFRLVEMGPGDGTLMADMLRVFRVRPEALAALDLWLVERSGPLRARQAERLASARPNFAADLAEVSAGAPVILIANELLDCLPARQFVRTEHGWMERRVGLSEQGLAFGLAPVPQGFQPPRGLDQAPLGVVVEVSLAQEALGREVGERLAADGGAALFIDYGRDRAEAGDTLQALARHQKVDPLAAPGEADLTQHADFPAFLAAGASAGAKAWPILTQAELLRRLGIEARAEALAAARPDRLETLERQFHRLTHPDEMGSLFKAACLTGAGLAPPAFEQDDGSSPD
jgi:NADH dehydrogenase [ubiquinone] 1 alpha subcomplex assembly factor 7